MWVFYPVRFGILSIEIESIYFEINYLATYSIILHVTTVELKISLFFKLKHFVIFLIDPGR